MTRKTGFLQRGVYACLLRKACKRAINGTLWMIEELLELLNAADEDRFFRQAAPPTF